MYGIRHDDYNYHQINLLLERPLKTYIKTVCCFPHQCRRKDCDTVMAEFRRSEKVGSSSSLSFFLSLPSLSFALAKTKSRSEILPTKRSATEAAAVWPMNCFVRLNSIRANRVETRSGHLNFSPIFIFL